METSMRVSMPLRHCQHFMKRLSQGSSGAKAGHIDPVSRLESLLAVKFSRLDHFHALSISSA